MKRFLPGLLWALLPLGIGLAVYLVLHMLFPPVPVLVFKADLGSALLVTGALFSLVLVSGVLGYRSAAQDGERRVLEAEGAAGAARRRFLRRLDHELKNPLTALRAALANAQGTTTPDQSGARALGDARHQVERLSRLVSDLRKLAELEERPLEAAQVDLSEVLEESVQAVAGLPQFEGRDIRLIITRVPWPLPAVTGDRDLLGLAFYNLVDNALKYSAAADAVEVRAVEDGRWANIEVADSGPGIAPDDLPRVFEELFRGENARGAEGSGLGLALVRRIIERHGGEISVRSREAGQKGTIFRVRLPLSQPSPAG